MHVVINKDTYCICDCDVVTPPLKMDLQPFPRFIVFPYCSLLVVGCLILDSFRDSIPSKKNTQILGQYPSCCASALLTGDICLLVNGEQMSFS